MDGQEHPSYAGQFWLRREERTGRFNGPNGRVVGCWAKGPSGEKNGLRVQAD
jgi:hypothetical protein